MDELIRVGDQDLRDRFFAGLIIFTGIVAAGVLMEFVEHLPIRKTRFDANGWLVVRYGVLRWIKRVSWISTIVVLIGVGGEGIFEGLTSRADGILQAFNQIILGDTQRLASEADERAAEARLELARLKLPRTLRPEQQLRIVGKIRQFVGQKYVPFVFGEQEARDLLWLIENNILGPAKWQRIKPADDIIRIGDVALSAASAVRIEYAPVRNHDLGQVARILASAFSAEGIMAVAEPDANQNETPDVMKINVGKKP